MRLPKHIMPDDYFSVTPKTDVQITALPFYIKEVGYCNDRKFIRGACNNYSDYLFVYSLCTMKFKKTMRNILFIPMISLYLPAIHRWHSLFLFLMERHDVNTCILSSVDPTHSSFTIISDGMTVRFISTSFITCWISFLRSLRSTINQTLCQHRCMPVL